MTDADEIEQLPSGRWAVYSAPFGRFQDVLCTAETREEADAGLDHLRERECAP